MMRSFYAPRGRLRAALPWLVLLCSLLWLPAASAQPVAVPQLSARVTDLTGTLTSEQRQSLEQALAEFERRKGAQLAVLIVPTTGEETIEQYGIRVAEAWKLGRRGVDDGLLLLVAKADRTLRIEVGYGLEGVVPDATANRVIDEIIVPRFRTGDFYGGIRAGLERLMGLIEGEPLPPPPPRASPQSSPWPGFDIGLLPVVFFGYIVLSRMLMRLLGRLPGAALTGGAIGVLLWLLVGSVLFGLVAGFIVFVFSLGNSMRTFTGGFHVSGGSGGYSGRSGGSFSSGGSSFGGGGGSFGGGGASGRW